jgi:hypothetical protein
MGKLGYVEGRNLSNKSLYADNHLERLPALAAQLVKHNVDLIVINGSAAVRAAQQAVPQPVLLQATRVIE